MKYPVITIGREHGSGGRIVAEKVAQKLNIPLYDKKLIRMIAQDSGLSENYIESAETKRTSSFLFNIYFDSNNLPVDDQIFITQSNIIKQIAERGPCVIVGRCGDYVLREMEDCLKVFIYAPLEERIKRVTEVYNEKTNDPKKYLEKYDKQRSAYYNRFTEEKWGDPHNYHLMLNSTIGLDAIADYIVSLVLGEDKN